MSLRGGLLFFLPKQSHVILRLLRHTCPGGRCQGNQERLAATWL